MFWDLFKKKVTSSEESENSIGSINTEEKLSSCEIISYKEESGIVYGYFNQYALDVALYNRAKERTNNFKDKDKWESERRKRPVKLEDIRKAKHSIRFMPNTDGDFVTNGDVLLVVGLDSLRFSNYCSSNLISEYETRLCCGINIYSNHEGIFTNSIKDKVIGYCNLGNEVKNGDLLFTIELANKPEEKETEEKEVLFNYSMLSREFLDDIPYISELMVNNWLVDDFTKVEKGDDILEITNFVSATALREPDYKTTIKSPKSGYFIKKHLGFHEKLRKGRHLFTISSKETVDFFCPYDLTANEVSVNIDEFTKTQTIKGKIYGGSISGFDFDLFDIEFENIAGKNFLILGFDKKELNINKKCSLHLLMGDDTVISLSPIANPIKIVKSRFEAKFLLSPLEMSSLEKQKFIMWKITNEEGITIAQGTNNCKPHRLSRQENTELNSSEIFQNFIKVFNKAVKDNISEDLQQQVNQEKDIAKGKCHVYLMIDTSNNFHKIGISNSPKYREHTLQSDKPTIELLCSKEYPSRAMAEAIEAALHKTYASKRIRGEWFNLDSSDIEELKQALK